MSTAATETMHRQDGRQTVSIICLSTHHLNSRGRTTSSALKHQLVQIWLSFFGFIAPVTCTFSAAIQTQKKKRKLFSFFFFFFVQTKTAGVESVLSRPLEHFYQHLPGDRARSAARRQFTVLLCDAVYNKAQWRTQSKCVFGATCFSTVTMLSRTLRRALWFNKEKKKRERAEQYRQCLWLISCDAQNAFLADTHKHTVVIIVG